MKEDDLNSQQILAFYAALAGPADLSAEKEAALLEMPAAFSPAGKAAIAAKIRYGEDVERASEALDLLTESTEAGFWAPRLCSDVATWAANHGDTSSARGKLYWELRNRFPGLDQWEAAQVLARGDNPAFYAIADALRVSDDGLSLTRLQSAETDALARMKAAVQDIDDSALASSSTISEHEETVAELAKSARAAASNLGILHNEIATETLGTHYRDRAIAARNRQIAWAGATIVLGVFAVVAAFSALSERAAKSLGLTTEGPDVVWSHALLTLSIAGVAAFAARQGSNARRERISWTHVQLQLRTVLAFIERLGPERKDQALGELVPRFFPGQALDPHGAGAPGESEVLELVRLGADVARKR